MITKMVLADVDKGPLQNTIAKLPPFPTRTTLHI